MKSYEREVKAVKKEFNTVSITVARSCWAQLFRVVQSLTSLRERKQNLTKLAITY